MTLTLIRDDEPLLVYLDWLTFDDQIYGLIAYTREGRAINLTPAEENEALERIYSEMPVSNYELY